MGLELPNPRRQMVKLSEILGSQTYHASHSVVTMALGKDIAGNPVVADLAKMPHLLVAGTTGSGKSVGINAMILSLLYKADASHTRLILIDPKMLEMSVYEGIPHLLAPVVTDMRQAGNALNWCVGEMEKRYRLMSKMGVRNLAGYNTKIRDAIKREEPIPNPFSLTPDQPEPLAPLPTIVVVIDELADLMMVVGKKIEELIARLAQKARAAGIHLILATQRPSVDVITGLIRPTSRPASPFRSRPRSTRAPFSTRWARKPCWARATCSTCRRAPACRCACTAPLSATMKSTAWSSLKAQGEPNYIEGLLEGGLDGDGAEGAGSVTGIGGDAESDPCTTRPAKWCSSTAARPFRWCSAICGLVTTARPGYWSRWSNRVWCRRCSPMATGTSWCRPQPRGSMMKMFQGLAAAAACAWLRSWHPRPPRPPARRSSCAISSAR